MIKANINIIFLDIDGVMNSENYFHNGPESLTWDMFNPDSVQLLNELTDLTNAKIIITSDWRKQHHIFEIIGIFQRNKVKADIIGEAPIIRFEKAYSFLSVPRGLEIYQALLNIQQARPNESINYVILDDDDSGILCFQKDNFVKIEPICGFINISKMIEARDILLRNNYNNVK
jgi:hypothetical protein